MTKSEHQSKSENPPSTSTVAIAWVVTLLGSSLGDIFCFKLTGAVPLWLLGAKAGLLAALIGLSGAWAPVRPLRPFFIVLLALASLMGAFGWALASPVWRAWQDGQPFAVAGLGSQALKLASALLMISLLLLLFKRRDRAFLVRGDLRATAEPARWLGAKSPGPLWQFGMIFTAIVIVVQIFLFIIPQHPTAAAWGRLLPLVPGILLLAALNGFNEEVMMRASPIAAAIEAVGPSHAVGMAAVLFGLAHYIGGAPPGVVGVLTTTFLGWFFGKCLVDSRGLFWPWLFHAMQDILPFTMMALAAVA